jgi:hypothetical protein
MTEKIQLTDNRPDATEKTNFTGEYNLSLIKSAIENAKKEGIDPYTFLAMGLQESNLGNASYDAPANPFHAWGAKTENYNREKYPYPKFDDKFYEDSSLAYEKYNGSNSDLRELQQQLKELGPDPKVQAQIMKKEQLVKNLRNIWRTKSNIYNDYSKKHDLLIEKMKEGRRQEAFKVMNTNVRASAKFLKEKLAYAKKVFGNNIDEDLQLQAYNGYGWLPEGRGYYGEKRRLHGKKDRPYGKRIISLREHVFKNNPLINKLITGLPND